MTSPVSILDKLSAALADKYAIEREIGAGGMATVYLAEDVRHHRKVAVKVLHPDLSALLGSERFLKEIELTANLQHPHILPLFDSGDAGGLLYYVMPYVEGESLRRRLEREQQLPVGDAIRIATEVADALEYAHKRGVVHRDIKPENILIHDGRPLVADFGIALAVQQAGGARMTQTGMSLGTPQYMAPEQAMGDKSVDHRADIYALGAVTYEMLSGEAPFIGPNSQAIIARLLTEAPRSLSRHRHTIPEHVERAVLTALEKLPADRFATAAQFGEALSAGKANGASAAVSQSARARPRMRAVSLRSRTAAIASAAAVAGVALGWLIARFPGGGDTAPSAAVEFVVDAQMTLSGTTFRQVAVAHDGSAVAYASAAEQNRTQLVIRRLDDANVRVVHGASGNIVQEPAFSLDGQMLAFYADQQLRVVDLRGGGARVLARMSPTHGGISWGLDGLIIFQRGFGRGLSVVHESSGEVRELTQVDTASGHRDHRWPSVLPGGRSAVFTIWRGAAETATIGFVSIETGEVRELVRGFFPRYSAGHLLFALPSAALQAVPFDPRRGEVRGVARSILDSLPIETAAGSAGYDASANGTLVVAGRSRASVPVLVDLDGGAVDIGMPEDFYLSPRVSTRGNAIAVGRDSRIWLRDLNVGTFGPVSPGNDFYPLWGRDGKKLYYSRTVESDVHVYSVAADGSTGEVPVVRARGQFRAQALSPDGRHLLIRVNAVAGGTSANRGARTLSPTADTAGVNQYDLWVVTLDSALATRPWLTTPYLERAPDFSPDGRWVAYSSDESGRDEIYVRPFPGPGGRTQLSSNGGTEPMWLRDGRGVLYRSGDEFVLTPVRIAPTLEVAGPPQTRFRGNFYSYPWSRQYDLHPDGRRLVALRRTAETSNLRVIVNWPARNAAREIAPRPRR